MKVYKETRRVYNAGEPDNIVTLYWEQAGDSDELEAIGFFARPVFNNNRDTSGGLIRETYSITRREDGFFEWQSPPDSGTEKSFEEALELMPELLVEPDEWQTLRMMEQVQEQA